MNTYAHMCKDGHEEIGHNDSENELCPLCRAMNRIEELEYDLDEARVVADLSVRTVDL